MGLIRCGMDLRQLRYFVAVADTLHFGRAARRLAISQPPLSRQIAALERELGVALFERSTRGVRLTPSGSALLPRARRLLADADTIATGARELARGEVGLLRIGFLAAATFSMLPRLISSFRRARPGVRLVLTEATSDRQLVALAEASLDAGVLLPPVADPALAWLSLVREPLVAALPAGRRWPPRLALARLAGEPFILFPRPAGASLYDLIVNACEVQPGKGEVRVVSRRDGGGTERTPMTTEMSEIQQMSGGILRGSGTPILRPGSCRSSRSRACWRPPPDPLSWISQASSCPGRTRKMHRRG